MRKRHDIKELVANTDQAFLKDVWEEGDDECYKCASETQLGHTVYCRCKPESEVAQFDRAEALYRIHIIQTMMCELLWMWEGNYPAHKGLSELAAYHVQEAMDDLAEAYQAQGAFAFETDEDLSDNQRQAASWECGEDVSENQAQGLYVFEEDEND